MSGRWDMKKRNNDVLWVYAFVISGLSSYLFALLIITDILSQIALFINGL